MPVIIPAASVKVDPERVFKELRHGKAIGLPTETVYGLAADATNGNAVAGIFEMKRRPKFNPLICHVSGKSMAAKHCEWNETADRLAERFWPGPLTMVLTCVENSKIHPLATANLDTVGLRCPKGIAREIIDGFGSPLAAPSANRSGRVSPTRPSHVAREFEETDLMIIDAGPCEEGIESTIVRIDKNTLTILRPGTITNDMIEDVSGIPTRSGTDTKVIAPGMLKSHYAPDSKVHLNCNECPSDAALLRFGNSKTPCQSGQELNLSKTANLREAAANLYDYLKRLDDTGLGNICVDPIPAEGLGLAINDRLQRAAAPKGSE